MSTLLTLFFEFFKTGLFAVGGGLATIPFLTDMEVRFPQWFAGATVADIVAIAESTPGPIGINAATYAGFSAAGVLGAVTATIALTLPSFVIITIISHFFERYRSSKLVGDLFTGMRPMVAGLIAAAAWSMLQLSVFRKGGAFFASVDWLCLALFAALLGLMYVPKLKKLHPIVFILLGAVLGIVFSL
ncbi:MAG: chromate transporter [Clostridia bacterium]|nr:chromate transporter [Clostridia bacterium]